MFTKENGYDASFAYSLKNDEQITAAQKFIQDGVDYLLLSAADTSGWDSVLKDAQDAGTHKTAPKARCGKSHTRSAAPPPGDI